MTNPTISADSNEALVWLKTQCELSGKREFKGDARAMLRAIRQAEQAAEAKGRAKAIEEVEHSLDDLRTHDSNAIPQWVKGFNAARERAIYLVRALSTESETV